MANMLNVKLFNRFYESSTEHKYELTILLNSYTKRPNQSTYAEGRNKDTSA